MSPSDIARYFIEHSQYAEDVDALTQLFQVSLYRLGFRYFACSCHVDPLRPHAAVMRLNYPQIWIDTYSQMRLHCIDPVFERATKTSRGFHWNSKAFRQCLTKPQREMLGEAQQFGLLNGYTVPIRSPKSPFLIDASCSVIPESLAVPQGHYLVLAEMAFTMFERVVELTQPINRKIFVLSPRQRQCMELVSQGKTNWEIGMLLQLSEKTIKTHIDIAKLRLDAVSRSQGVIQGYLTHEVSISELQRQLLHRSGPAALKK